LNNATAETLSRINRRFYLRHATTFDNSRRAPWPGWNTLLTRLNPTEWPAGKALRVFDAGCGNGRFGHFLATNWSGPVAYLGLDSSAELLGAASRSLASKLSNPRLGLVDLMGTTESCLAGDEVFDLVVLFGVLHHIPAETARLALLRRLIRHLAPGGLLAVSVWRFDRDPRLAQKTVGWDELESFEVDPKELETGDHLLTWAGDRLFPRYCHLTGEKEIDRLVEALSLPKPYRFADDGSSRDRNHYLLFQG
jgi:SAM-dependent methyltransferase